MSNPNSIKQRRQPREYPKYPPELQRKLLRFVVAFAFDCNAMVLRTRKMLEANPDSDMIRSQVDYWLHALSACRDLAARVGNRQRHLVEMSDEAFHGVLEEWGLLSRHVSGPESLSLSAPTSAKPKAGKRGGKKQDRSPVASSGEWIPTLLTPLSSSHGKESDSPTNAIPF